MSYGFSVEYDKVDYGAGYEPLEGWIVSLPHSCDRWCVAEYVDQPTAVARLEAFIAEANDALTALREGRQIAPTTDYAWDNQT